MIGLEIFFNLFISILKFKYILDKLLNFIMLNIIK